MPVGLQGVITMREFSQAMDWDLAYPLGVIAAHTCAGRLIEALAHARALVEHAGDICTGEIEENMLRAAYRCESQMVRCRSKNKAPMVILEPIWVADRVKRKPLMSHPNLYVYALKDFIEQLEDDHGL